MTEQLNNKDLTLEEARAQLGNPDLKKRLQISWDKIKGFVNRKPRSHKHMISAGLKQGREHPLIIKFGGNLSGQNIV